MKTSKKVLGLVCSPHNSGNTAILTQEVLRGAREKGYETDLKCLGDFNINPLIADDYDKPFGIKGPEDDMKLFYPLLESMNILVFGSPIYYDHVSSRAKIFIDRLIYYSKHYHKDRFPKDVQAVIILTYEWNKPEAYDNVIEWIKGRFENYWGMKVVASLKAENTVKHPVALRKDLLKKAYQIGRTL